MTETTRFEIVRRGTDQVIEGGFASFLEASLAAIERYGLLPNLDVRPTPIQPAVKS